jgi:hypothetical protein
MFYSGLEFNFKKPRCDRAKSIFAGVVLMHAGKLVLAQLTEHLPLTAFRRCVALYELNLFILRPHAADRPHNIR